MKNRAKIFFLIPLGIIFALTFLGPIDSVQAGTTMSQTFNFTLPYHTCAGEVGPFTFNAPIKSGTGSVSVSGTNGVTAAAAPTWLNKSIDNVVPKDPLVSGAKKIILRSGSYYEDCDEYGCDDACNDFTSTFVCTTMGEECDSYSCWACCSTSSSCDGAVGYWTSWTSTVDYISASVTFYGTRNYYDEPNLAPSSGSRGYPYGANIGVTTSAPSYPTLSWTTSGQAQNGYRVQAWGPGSFDSGDVASGAQSVNVGSLPAGWYNWRVAVYSPSAGNPWTGWANGDAFTVCVDTSWSPDPSTVCSGQSFTQTSNCGNTRLAVGTKCCDTSWSPDPSTVWIGVAFTQTSNCGTTRAATGTKLSPPTVSGVSVTQPDYRYYAPNAFVSWTFSDPQPGDTQSAYQVQAATNAGFSGPGMVIDTGKVSSASNSYATVSGVLVYNKSYYWRVKVWDNHDTVGSGWIDYDDPADPDGDGNRKTITTPLHEYPTISDIFWSPLRPSANETFTFGATTICYVTGGGTTGCPSSGYSWTIASGNPSSVVSQPSGQSKISSGGTYSITLNLTDSDGYPAAPRTESITIRLPLPGWKEIAP